MAKTKGKIIDFDPFRDKTPEQERAIASAKPRYPSRRKNKTVSVSIPVETKTRLENLAARRGCTVSDLLRAAVVQILAENADC